MKMNTTVSAITAALLIGGLTFSTESLAQRYYGQNLCGYDGFKCVKVTRGATWESMFSNARERELVMRLNRTNMPLRYRTWIVVPSNLSSISNNSLSPFPEHRSTGGKKELVVNLTSQAFGAYDAEGNLVHWGPVSGGRGYCPDVGHSCNTATGSFKIYRKQGEDCKSSKFPIETNGGAPMPYCMHFHGGFALHGSTLPGYNASHGCVRLFFNDAKWLNNDFLNIGTTVIVSR
ncbi:MAG: L,D-transpeptidase [Gammaproteobacteria bacterium]|nr:L,D-transpeptidase [Gammaproteobacteria bacterium]